MFCLTSLLFSIFHYYTIILISRLSIISCLYLQDVYLSLVISWSRSFVTVTELFCCEFFETFVNLSAVYGQSNLLVFDISLSYYCFNLKSSIISCILSSDIYLSLGISLWG